MKSLLAVVVLLLPTLARGATVSVGGASIELPNPPGFAEVTPQMTVAYDLGQQLVPPDNVQFASFIPENEAAKSLKGEMPDFTRRFSVQSVKTLVNRPVSTSDFAQLKSVLRTQNEKIIKELEAKAPALMDGLSQKLSKRYDTKMALSLSKMVPFPGHDDTEHTFAYSMLVKYDLGVDSGNTTKSTSSGTITLIHVKDRVLFFYCFAEEEGLDWTKATAKDWSNAILAANAAAPLASGPVSPVKESLARVGSGFDWHEVGKMALVGAGVGLVVAVFGKLRKRKQ